MDVRRLRPGEWLAAAGAAALLVSLFADWYTVTVPIAPRGELTQGITGWQAFAVIDVLLALVAGAGLALALIQAVQVGPALPVAASVLATVAGLAGVLLAAYRLVNPPGPNDQVGLGAGAWLGLAAAAAIVVGAWMAMADERAPHIPPGPEPELRRL